MQQKIVLITGANRGMGLATAKFFANQNYHVIMVGKNESALNVEVNQLKIKNQNIEAFVADISINDDCHRLIKYIYESYSRVDILINNAGIYIEEANCLQSADEIFESTLSINTKAPYLLIKGILPLMQKNNYGRIVNVSSQLGSIAGESSHCLSYSLSKNSLNSLTRIFSTLVRGKNIKINSICPGWVKTDMGGASAPRSIEQGISGIIWAATLDENGPSGGFYHDKKLIDW